MEDDDIIKTQQTMHASLEVSDFGGYSQGRKDRWQARPFLQPASHLHSSIEKIVPGKRPGDLPSGHDHP